MIEIKKLEKLSYDQLLSMGFNGFKTDRIISVDINKVGSSIDIKLEEVVLDKEYVKQWESSLNSVKYFQNVIDEGYSLAAYMDDVLMAFVMVTYNSWNNSFWIENIRVSEDFKGTGVGKRLVDSLLGFGREKEVRIVGLEVQSSNYPAIKFYEKCGFDISGVDFHRYPQRDNDIYQVAIIMNINV